MKIVKYAKHVGGHLTEKFVRYSRMFINIAKYVKYVKYLKMPHKPYK